MDEDAVYDNLPEFDLGGNIKQIEDENVQLKDRILLLEKEQSERSQNINEMKQIQANLEKNFSELFKTAKAEIERKDRVIAELRGEIDRILFNRMENKRKRDNNDNFHFQRDSLLVAATSKKPKTEEQSERSGRDYKHRSHSHHRSRSRDKSRSKYDKHNRSKSRDSRQYYSSSDSNNSKKFKESNDSKRENHRSRSKEAETKGKIQILDNILIAKANVESTSKIKHSSSSAREPKQEELFRPDVKIIENRNTLSVNNKKQKSNIEEVSKILLEKQFKKSLDESSKEKTHSSHSKTVSNNRKEHHRRKSGESNKTDAEKNHKTLSRDKKLTPESEISSKGDREALQEEKARQFLQKDTIVLNALPIVNKSKEKEIKHREEKKTIEEVKTAAADTKKTDENSSQSNNNQTETVPAETKPISSPKKQRTKPARPKPAEKTIEEPKSDNPQALKAILPEKLPENTGESPADTENLPGEHVKVSQQKPPAAKIRKPREKAEEVVAKPLPLPLPDKKPDEIVKVINISPQKVAKKIEMLHVEHVTAESELSELSNENSPEKQKKRVRRLNIKEIVDETKCVESQPEKTIPINEKPPENTLNIQNNLPVESVTVTEEKSPKKPAIRARKLKVEESKIEEKAPASPKPAENGTVINPQTKARRPKFKVNVTQAKEMREKLKSEAINKVFIENLLASPNQQPCIQNEPKKMITFHPVKEKKVVQIATSEKVEDEEKPPVILKELRVSLVQVETPTELKEEKEEESVKELNVKRTEPESRRKFYKRTKSPRKAINVIEEEEEETVDSNIVSQIEANLIAETSPSEPAPKRKYQRKAAPVPQLKLIDQETEMKPKRKQRKTAERSLDVNNIVDGKLTEDGESPTKENRVLRSSVKKPAAAPLVLEETVAFKMNFSPILECDDKSDSIHFSLNSSLATEAGFNLSRDENFPESQATVVSSTPISQNALSVLEEDLNTSSSVGQEEKSSLDHSGATKKSKKRKRNVQWKILD